MNLGDEAIPESEIPNPKHQILNNRKERIKFLSSKYK